MAVVGNIATEVGDILQIETSVPVVGLLTLTGFTDITPGVSGSNRFFQKRFRYSTDGVNFSDWLDLTVPNLTGITVDPTDVFLVQYQYERSGTDASGDLSFNEVELQGTFQEVDCGPSYDNSIFAQYFDCLDAAVLQWEWLTCLRRFTRNGLLLRNTFPEMRQVQISLEYWRYVASFFAYLVELSRQFENFSNDDRLVRSFLEDRGLYFCGNEDLAELRDVMVNFYREVQKRGTLLITEEIDGEINGELLRLICKEPLDFFQLVYNDPKFSTLNVGNTSLLSKSTEGNDGFDLSWEPGQGFTDLAEYPIIDPGAKVTIVSEELVLTGINSGEDAGIGDNDQN